jgi:hypothetical protein
MRVIPKIATMFLFVAASVGCQSTDNASSDPGELRLALTLPGSVTIDAVAWQVLSSTSAVIASGTIDTSHAGAAASLSVGVPAGTGDTVKMSAMTSTGATCMGTSPAFNVTAGMTVPVGVTLNCSSTSTGGGLGSVVVTGMVVEGDNCPVLSSWMLSPQQTAASGGTIQVSAMATDADMGETLTYTWSATSGTFINAGVNMTQYVCGPAGSNTLTVTVTDNHTPTPCSINVSFPPVACN